MSQNEHGIQASGVPEKRGSSGPSIPQGGGKTRARWTRKHVGYGLLIALAFQLGVLGWEYLGSVWPLWFGEPILLGIAPMDPRSLFRGNYVQLRYAVSEIDRELAEGTFKRGDVAYVELVPKGRLHVAKSMRHQPPSRGVFLRGRVRHSYGDYSLQYGIEAYFLPKHKALAAERARAELRVASVRVLSNGRAAIEGFAGF